MYFFANKSVLSVVAFVFAVTNKEAYCDHQRSYDCSYDWKIHLSFQLLLRYVSAQYPMPTFRGIQSLTYAMYGAFLRQVKYMNMSLDDGKNSLLALAMAGKSAAVFDSAKACLEHDLNPKEV